MSLPFLPSEKPRKSRSDVEQIAVAAGVPVNARGGVYLLSIRGYYHDRHSDNQRGIYDDAMFLVSPDMFVPFNCNTDPSVFRQGIAKLKAGIWQYKLGIHGLSKPRDRQYQALVQAGEVTVLRDSQGPDTGFFGINIHRGGASGTSSLGCQTIPPAQWPTFIALVKQELSRHGQKTLPYVLTE